jgi:hypothetical protein
LLLAGLGSAYLFLRFPPATVQDVASSPPSSARTLPREEAEEPLWRKTLPLTFTATHSHRIGGCSGSLLLDTWGIEYRSKEHERLRLRFDEIRVMQREDARRLHVETNELGKLKTYNFSLVGRLGNADWVRYRKLAKR